ncbi:hypothetical protein [Ensifer aridi]|uniref:hypothetical protein n=1 Tax=Ensifer aridi TaxID=1708715 RepID=UPI000479FC4C|nr:hypothetical protein [Ensifer aridi]
MKPLATSINVIAFMALFVAHASATPADGLSGVRRALQTYASEWSNDTYAVTKLIWRIDGGGSEPDCPPLPAGMRLSAEGLVLPCAQRPRWSRDQAASLFAPPASVSRKASPQAFASVRTRRM